MAADKEREKVPDGLPPMAAVARQVLAYRPARILPHEIMIERDGEQVTITIPQSPPVLAMIGFSGVILLGGIVMAGMFIACWDRGVSIASCPFGGVAFLGMGMAASLRRLIYIAREGAIPSQIRVWPDGIEVHAAGDSKPVVFYATREEIAHVEVYPRVSGISNKLVLQVIGHNGTLHEAVISWPRGYPMAELEQLLGEVLKLPQEPPAIPMA